MNAPFDVISEIQKNYIIKIGCNGQTGFLKVSGISKKKIIKSIRKSAHEIEIHISIYDIREV